MKSRGESKVFSLKTFIICIIIVYVVAILGSLFTGASVHSLWYESYKPSITPPNYVFPIVWNILFFLIAISIYLAWTNAEKKKKNILTLLFGLNLAFNLLWSFAFFTMRGVGIALFDLILLLVTIILLIKYTWKINKASAYLLIPYLAWVIFAGILNYLTFRLI
jgi:translocator protein